MARFLSQYGQRLRQGHGLVAALTLGVVYLLAAEVGHALSIEPGHVATFWPASGLYLMALTLATGSRLPLIAGAAAANLISDWLHGKLWLFSITMVMANSLEAMLGAWVLRRGAEGPFSLERSADVKSLLLVAVFVPLISALVPSTSAMLLFGSHFQDVYLVWWLADCVGILIVAPIVWTLYSSLPFTRLSAWRLLELTGSYALVVASTLLVFTGQLDKSSFPFLLMPLLFWPAIRFGTVTVACHIAIMSVIIAITTRNGTGTLAEVLNDPADRALIVQAFLATVSAPFLLLAAMWHERVMAAEELERRIAIRTQELAEADRRKDHFLAVLAHELRNPMAPLSYALDAWPAVIDDKAKREELRQMMVRQVHHLSGLIDDLLDVSRIAGGKILLRKERLDVREVVEAAIQGVRSQAEQAGHALHVELDAEPIWVHGDRARLNQILGNLLNNAIKYTGQGGQIHVRVGNVDGWCRLEVQDNGPGIPPSDLKRIFELFTQVDQTLERAHGGLGIGLTLVQNLVGLHDGHVVAESAGLGHGSRFVVHLPAERPRSTHKSTSRENQVTYPQSPEAHKSNAGNSLPPKRILVVDDTQASGRMLGVLLKSLGQEVEICFDGPSAIQAAATWQPVLIFLDIAMPGMNGYEVASQLKANPDTKQIMLVAMTGFGQESDRQRALAAGFDHHLVKPAKLESLAEVIRIC